VSFLLDTGVWLWALDSTERLHPEARAILADGSHEVFLSAVTTWELSIKLALGKLKFPIPPAQSVPRLMREQNLKPLSVTHTHAARVFDLPLRHGDPFDRLLVAQALEENLTLLTADREFKRYDVPLVWCGR
jgi:PIN domain nuclease of toxin-antitoxin system